MSFSVQNQMLKAINITLITDKNGIVGTGIILLLFQLPLTTDPMLQVLNEKYFMHCE